MSMTQVHSNVKSEQTNGRPDDAVRQRGGEGVYSPRVDIVESSEAYRMFAFMPGVRPEEVSLHTKDGELVVHGKCAPRTYGKRFVHQEYGIGDFYRTFALNEFVDESKIDAKLENGVLTITLPKREALKPKRIAVNGR